MTTPAELAHVEYATAAMSNDLMHRLMDHPLMPHDGHNVMVYTTTTLLQMLAIALGGNLKHYVEPEQRDVYLDSICKTLQDAAREAHADMTSIKS